MAKIGDVIITADPALVAVFSDLGEKMEKTNELLEKTIALLTEKQSQDRKK